MTPVSLGNMGVIEVSKEELLTPRVEPDDYVALFEQQARELRALLDWRERVRTAFNVVDESVKMLPRDSQVAVDGASFSRLGMLIEFGGDLNP